MLCEPRARYDTVFHACCALKACHWKLSIAGPNRHRVSWNLRGLYATKHHGDSVGVAVLSPANNSQAESPGLASRFGLFGGDVTSPVEKRKRMDWSR